MSRLDVMVIMSIVFSMLGDEKKDAYLKRIETWTLSKDELEAIKRRAKIGALFEVEINALERAADSGAGDGNALIADDFAALGILKKTPGGDSEYSLTALGEDVVNDLGDENEYVHSVSAEAIERTFAKFEKKKLIEYKSCGTPSPTLHFTNKVLARAQYWSGFSDGIDTRTGCPVGSVAQDDQQ